MSKVFKKIARIQETSKIIHGFWTKENIFVYSTYNHFKYVLPNGDRGILKSVKDIQYPVGFGDNTVFAFDIDNNLTKFDVSKQECLFKLSLSQNDIAAVKQYVKTASKQEGSAMVAYLHRKNYPAVALSMTTDNKCKFQLALKSGNLQAAYDSALALKSPDNFETLAEEALLQGCSSVGDCSLDRGGGLPGKQEPVEAELPAPHDWKHARPRAGERDGSQRGRCHDPVQRVDLPGRHQDSHQDSGRHGPSRPGIPVCSQPRARRHGGCHQEDHDARGEVPQEGGSTHTAQASYPEPRGGLRE